MDNFTFYIYIVNVIINFKNLKNRKCNSYNGKIIQKHRNIQISPRKIVKMYYFFSQITKFSNKMKINHLITYFIWKKKNQKQKFELPNDSFWNKYYYFFQTFSISIELLSWNVFPWSFSSSFSRAWAHSYLPTVYVGIFYLFQLFWLIQISQVIIEYHNKTKKIHI